MPPNHLALQTTLTTNKQQHLGEWISSGSPGLSMIMPAGLQRKLSRDRTTCTPTTGLRPNWRLSRTQMFRGGMYSSSLGSICQCMQTVNCHLLFLKSIQRLLCNVSVYNRKALDEGQYCWQKNIMETYCQVDKVTRHSHRLLYTIRLILSGLYRDRQAFVIIISRLTFTQPDPPYLHISALLIKSIQYFGVKNVRSCNNPSFFIDVAKLKNLLSKRCQRYH